MNKDLLKQKLLRKRILIPSTLILIFLVILVGFSIYSLKYQITDDAFVEGRLISIAPRVSGQVISLNVNDNDFVKEGQLILEIDPNDYINKVKELEASLKEAIALKDSFFNETQKAEADVSQVNENFDFAKKDYERYSKLKKDGLCTKQEYDRALSEYNEAFEKQKAMNAYLKGATAKYESAKSNIEKLNAKLAQAKLNLSYTKIYAPQDGHVSSRKVEKGNYVNVGQPLLEIVSPEVWVVANFKETQLTHMKKGQRVKIKIDTYPHKRFYGIVDSIQKASGAKASLFPPENAVGSYIKVVQRIPVKILFTDDISKYEIAPGMSVVPRVQIR